MSKIKDYLLDLEEVQMTEEEFAAIQKEIAEGKYIPDEDETKPF